MFVKENWNILELVRNIRSSQDKELVFNWDNYTDESLKELSNMLNVVDSMNENYTVIIHFNKIREAELSNALNLSNTDVKISLDMQTYSKEEFQLLDNQLDDIIKDVDRNASPFEKYNQIYNIVRKYKEYKVIDQSNVTSLRELINNKDQSCNLKYILDGEYMDCRGFSVLLQTLLNKCDIESCDFGFNVNFPNGNQAGHARVMVNLDDEKYNIHGIFISDPTWDSQNKDEQLEYSLLPIESMRESIYEKCNETLLFDSNNSEEFLDNITELNDSLGKYRNITSETIKMVNRIDRKESEKLKKLSSEELYLELQKYILTRSNTNILNDEKGLGGRNER